MSLRNLANAPPMAGMGREYLSRTAQRRMRRKMRNAAYTLNMSGIKRVITPSIEYLLERFPAVAVLGARQIGKTMLLSRLRPGAPFFDLESPSDLAHIEDDPEFLLAQYADTLVIDEAQYLPELFSVLRV